MPYSLPVMFQYDIPGFEYGSIGGTCFPVRFQGSIYIFTANHVLKNNNPKDIRFPVRYHSRVFIPFDNVIDPFIHRKEHDDNSYEDVAVYHVSNALDHAVEKSRIVAIPRIMYRRPLPRENSKLICCGFSKSTNTIDNAASRISQSMGYRLGDYDGVAPYQHCHRIKLNPADYDYLNGFSGSPVFCIYPATGEMYFYGLLIMPTVFIDGYVLWSIIESLRSSNSRTHSPLPESVPPVG